MGLTGVSQGDLPSPPLPTQSHNLLLIVTNDGQCWRLLHCMCVAWFFYVPKKSNHREVLRNWVYGFQSLSKDYSRKFADVRAKSATFSQFIFKDPKCWLQAEIEPRLTTH